MCCFHCAKAAPTAKSVKQTELESHLALKTMQQK